MPPIKGKKEYERFREGKGLTRKEAILVQCYLCSKGKDCKTKTCPLYTHMPYLKGKIKRPLSEKQREQLEALNLDKSTR